MEFDWFWGALEGLIAGDQYGTGPIPMPSPAPPRVPDVISEVPQTWEEAAETNPEWFEPILETRPGHVADSYPQDVDVATTPAQDDSEEDMAVTWMEWGQDFVGGLVGNWLDDGNIATGVSPATQQFVGGAGPSTPANQAATAAAMQNCEGMAWTGGTPPKGYKVVNHCGVGVLRKVRRRRRRRMLTASDASDLATIVGIVGKGQMAAQMINRR